MVIVRVAEYVGDLEHDGYSEDLISFTQYEFDTTSEAEVFMSRFGRWQSIEDNEMYFVDRHGLLL